MRFEWWMFVIGAVMSWGIYVPVLHEGQSAMGVGDPKGSGALRAFLCVGLAYFVTAVVIPLFVLYFDLAQGEPFKFSDNEGSLKTYALTFATLGGVAGAAGALCIIFSIKYGGPPLYVAPLVFAGAPIVNAIVSVIWHPPEELGKSEYTPGWIMFAAGILLAAAGAGLVLYSKGYIDQKTRELKQAKAKMATMQAMANEAPPGAPAPATGIKPAPDSGIQGNG